MFPALVGVALNTDVVSRSIRLNIASGLMVMSKFGVPPEDIETVAIGPMEAEGWR